MPDLLSSRLADAIELVVQIQGRDSRKQLLHDALEDKPDLLSAEAIEERFGNRVLQLVRISTDTAADYAGGDKPLWKLRKEAYLLAELERLVELLERTTA